MRWTANCCPSTVGSRSLTSAGAVEVTAPRVNDRHTDPDTGERKRFSSAILPPWCRKTPKITEVLPLLYLHGLSSGDFVPALGQFLGVTGEAVGGGDHPADRNLEGRAARVRGAGRQMRLCETRESTAVVK